MTSGQSPALSLGSLCYLTPSLWVFWDRGPIPSSFSPHKGREVGAEKSMSWASGGGLPSWLFTAKKKTLAGLETLPPPLLYSAASCVVRVEGAFLLITQQGRSHLLAGGGGSCHRGQLASLLICSQWGLWQASTGGAPTWPLSGERSCVSEAPAQTQEGKPATLHVLWKQRARRQVQPPEQSVQASVSWGCNLTVAGSEDRNHIFTHSKKAISLSVGRAVVLNRDVKMSVVKVLVGNFYQ